MLEFRCGKCNKLLAKYAECTQLEIKCPRCGLSNLLATNLPSSKEEPTVHLCEMKKVKCV